VWPRLGDALIAALDAPDRPLTRAALVIARLEYPQLDPQPSLDRLAELGEHAAERLAQLPHDERVDALATFLFEEQAFEGNHADYDDARNSCLNAVLERRRGIPISLSVLYLDVAVRAGLDAAGINFPGHFLVRVEVPGGEPVIVDPFNGGSRLTDDDCRDLLNRAGGGGFTPALLAPAHPRAIATRMVTNLERLYLAMRALPQARATIDLLLALNPGSLGDRRNRGLLSMKMGDVQGALRDLQTCLDLARPPFGPAGAALGDEAETWAHVKDLRRQLASLN
jgi:regulator of sirC expression with transglutaminase-like and TPR domain